MEIVDVPVLDPVRRALVAALVTRCGTDVAEAVAARPRLAHLLERGPGGLSGYVALDPVVPGHEAAAAWCAWFGTGPSALAEVASLYVDPDDRDRGLGRALAATAVDLAVARGLCPVAVVALGNEASRRALAAAGFVEVAVLDDPAGRPHRYLARPAA